MNMKKILASVLAGATVLSMASVAAFAANGLAAAPTAILYDEDYENTGGASVADGATLGWNGAAGFVIENARPNATYYIYLGDTGDTVDFGAVTANLKILADGDYVRFDNDKDKNGKLIDDIEIVTDKSEGNTMSRDQVYIKVMLNDATMTSEQKVTGTLEFKSKSKDQGKYGLTGDLPGSEEFTIDYTLWVNNTKVENDDNPDAGDRVYYDPESNEDNVLIWGDDRAALEFEADDDAGKFYARLSTKSNSEIYAEYGDPVNADLYFYDFVGNPTVPSTSRATLTLGIPWDEDDDYVPDPEMCYIYEIDADGYLTDVTDLFTYSEDEQEIDGWSIRTRTLGTYVLSDTELDIEVYDDTDDTDDTTDDADTVTPGKEIPNTGANDMVNVAVVAAVVSLAAAGAVAFKKSSK